MKKILLGTTLLSAVGLFAGAALAEGPKVTLGGFADFQIGVVDEDLDTNTRGHAFRSDTEVTVRVDGKTEGGLGYGGGIDLEADTGDTGSSGSASSDADNQGLNASRTFVYMDGSWGRVEMGSEVGAQGTMKVDASNIARATGGIDGDFTYYMTAPGGNFWVTPDLDLGYGAGALGNESQENLNKVTYYTPRFAGFQLGVSYTVNNDDRGQQITRADNNSGDLENIWSGGISYEGKFDAVSIAAAVTGEHGSAEVGTQEDLRAWNAGAKFGYMGFSLAGSYGNVGNALNTASSNVDDTIYWTLGAAYETGPYGISVTWLDSERGVTSSTTNDFNNLSVGVDYKLAPGFTPYAEVSFFDADLTGSTVDNEGTVFIAGTQLNF